MPAIITLTAPEGWECVEKRKGKRGEWYASFRYDGDINPVEIQTIETLEEVYILRRIELPTYWVHKDALRKPDDRPTLFPASEANMDKQPDFVRVRLVEVKDDE